MSVSTSKRLFFALLLSSLYSALALGATANDRASSTSPSIPKHFFNSQLLMPGEAEATLRVTAFADGHFRYGVSENFELGFGAALVPGLSSAVPSVSIKHRMFRRKSFHMAFSSRTYITSEEMAGEGSGFAFLSFTGLATSFFVSPTTTVNLGLHDVYVKESRPSSDFSLSLHLPLPTVGIDTRLSEVWTLTSWATYFPTYATGQITSAGIDADITLDAVKAAASTVAIFAAATRSWGSVDLELGGLLVEGLFLPIVSIAWRQI